MNRWILLALVLVPSGAMGWRKVTLDEYWSSCDPVHLRPPTGHVTFHPEAGAFTAAELVEIDRGLSAWDAGPSAQIRGADVELELGAPVSAPTLNNAENNILKIPFQTSELEALGIEDPAPGSLRPSYDAAVIRNFRNDRRVRDCDGSDQPELDEINILINEGKTYDVSGAPPDHLEGPSDPSLAWVVLHEAGHALGADHEFEFLTTMWPQYPSIGDHGHELDVDENHVKYVQYYYPDPSTGDNFSLSKFMVPPARLTEPEPPAPIEAFPQDTQVWLIPRGATRKTALTDNWRVQPLWQELTGGRIAIHNQGTQSRTGVDITWWLIQEQYADPDEHDCEVHTSGPTAPLDARIVVQQRTANLGVGRAYVIDRDITVPSTHPITGFPTTTGVYRLCIEIDPLDVFTETNEEDNTIMMDMPVEITE